jgi:putative transposase
LNPKGQQVVSDNQYTGKSLSLGNTYAERAEKYGKWLRETVPEGEWKLIREATQRGQLTANRKYELEISKKLGRRIELRGPGRPQENKK